MNSLYLSVPILYNLVVIGICGYLLVRGFTQPFLVLFALAALLHALPPVAMVVMQSGASGYDETMRWMPAISAVGFLGALLSAAGFASLALFLVRLRSPAQEHGESKCRLAASTLDG